jgi:ADP-heptose:LPS heptosyltransferase
MTSALVLPMQRGDSFGDLMVQVPVLHALRQLGAARIVVAAPHPFVRILADVGAADRVEILADEDAAGYARLIADEAPGWAVSLRPSSFRAAWRVHRCQGARRAGFSTWWNRWMFDGSAPRVKDTYYPFVFGRVLAPFGAAIDPPAASASLADGVAEPSVLLLPAGKGAGKQWGFANYLALAERLVPALGVPAVIVVGPREAAEAEAALVGRSGVRLEVAPSPRRTIALARAARVVVANDCGPGHLAQMSGAPMVTLFPNPRGGRSWREPLLRLWWWERPGAVAITTAQARPIADIPVDVVAAATLAVAAEPSRAPALQWWE